MNLSFSISPTQFKIEYPVRLTIQALSPYVRYGQRVPPSCVGIAFVGSKPLGKDDLTLRHLGGTDENQPNGVLAQAIVLSRGETGFTSKVSRFLLTDVSNTDSDGNDIPLFYVHDLADSQGWVPSYSALRIIDQDNSQIASGHYQVVEETVEGSQVWRLFHDLIPDPEKGIFYLVTFRSGNGEVVSAILDNSPAFRWLPELDPFLDRTSRTYSVRGDSSGKLWVETLYSARAGQISATRKLFFLPQEEGQIKAYHPVRVANNLVWFPRFSHGSFISIPKDKIRRFAIPEYYGQSFIGKNKIEAVRQIPSGGEANEADVLDAHTAWCHYIPLIIDERANQFIDIVITNSVGEAYDGYTSNPHRTNWYGKGGSISLRQISRLRGFSINKELGLIRLPYALKPDDRVFVYGYYREYFYHYRDLDLNPVTNPGVRDKLVYFYLRHQLILDRRAIDDTERGLYHLIINDVGEILDYPKDDDGTPLDPDLKIVKDGDVGMPKRLDKFQELYPEKILVTKDFAGRYSAPEELTIYDVRKRGGGIREEVDINSLLNIAPEALWVADQTNWAGRPYPGMASCLVDIPFDMLEAAGGDWKEEDIKQVISRHMPLGMYPVVRYFGETPVISSAYATLEPATIHLSWNRVKWADSYRVYQRIGGSFVLLGDTGNLFGDFIATETADSIYQVLVKGIRGDYEGLGSELVTLVAK